VPFTRPARNRSWRPSSYARLASPKTAVRANEPEGGDRGARGERNRFAHEERERPRAGSSGSRSEKRAVKRASAQPRLASAGPSPPACHVVPRMAQVSRLRTRDRRRALRRRGVAKEDVRAGEHGAARSPESRAGNTAKHGCSSRKRVRSAEVGRTSRSVATPASAQSAGGHARPSSKEPQAPPDSGECEESERRRWCEWDFRAF
jgi:hypothetical protein